MKHTIQATRLAAPVAAGLAALLLSACGGGSSADTPAPMPTDQVPTSTTSSVSALTAFASAQASTEVDEPLKFDLVATTALAVADDAEPTPLK